MTYQSARPVARTRARCPVELFTAPEDRKLAMRDLLVAVTQGCAMLTACGLVHWAAM